VGTGEPSVSATAAQGRNERAGETRHDGADVLAAQFATQCLLSAATVELVHWSAQTRPAPPAAGFERAAAAAAERPSDATCGARQRPQSRLLVPADSRTQLGTTEPTCWRRVSCLTRGFWLGAREQPWGAFCRPRIRVRLRRPRFARAAAAGGGTPERRDVLCSSAVATRHDGAAAPAFARQFIRAGLAGCLASAIR